MAGVKLIHQRDAVSAFKAGDVVNLQVIGSGRGWYYTFQVRDPVTGLVDTYRTKTSKGHPRNWSEASTLFRHLLECFGVEHGSWQLQNG